MAAGDDPPLSAGPADVERPVGRAGPPYLLGLRLSGRRVIVAGGGQVADRRVPVLVRSGADVVVVSPSLTAGLEGMAMAGQISWQRRRYAPGDVKGAWLVQACTSDRAANDAIAAECESAGVWCVRADDRAASAAWTPASGEAGDAHVAVVTGDPRRSAGIRDAVVAGLRDGTIGARRGRAVVADPGTVHAAGTAAGPGADGPDLEGRQRAAIRGVALVGGGPGDPGLITVRGRQLLAEADVVVTDRLAPRSLLDELPPDVEIIDASKIPYGRAMAQDHINAALVEHALAGRFVVRLKGGDPFVFGRGAEEVLACLRAGVPVAVVPGVTSAVAVPGAAFVPVTHRGIAQEFHVVSAHVASGDQRSTIDWVALAQSSGTIVVLMAVERLDVIADALIRHGRVSTTPVAVIQDGTLPTQHTLTATLETVAEQAVAAGIRPPAVVVVGEVVNIAAQIAELLPGRQRWIGRA
ncbi:MAG TPA: uroporphyrinogen-III C-methyltransferase [Streptosporangiaceae bacterium]|nr:uroporphyrinogen-III C-methyltransferase [Streptosporangiaceae bacterium]